MCVCVWCSYIVAQGSQPIRLSCADGTSAGVGDSPMEPWQQLCEGFCSRATPHNLWCVSALNVFFASVEADWAGGGLKQKKKSNFSVGHTENIPCVARDLLGTGSVPTQWESAKEAKLCVEHHQALLGSARVGLRQDPRGVN